MWLCHCSGVCHIYNRGGVAVGNGGGIVDGENMMGLRIWKWERDVRNGKSMRGLRGGRS